MSSVINVYVAHIDEFKDNTVLPSYIGDMKNKNALAERRAAYGLLISAGVDITKCVKTESGKPTHPELCFSLSHSKGMCAVALSDKNVGIDIEKRICKDREKRIGEFIRHPKDYETDVTLLWTQKEAVFKLLCEKAFVPSRIDVGDYFTESRQLGDFTVTVAAEQKSEIIWHMS